MVPYMSFVMPHFSVLTYQATDEGISSGLYRNLTLAILEFQEIILNSNICCIEISVSSCMVVF